MTELSEETLAASEHSFAPTDLEYICMLLEIAGIYLTPAPGTVFALEDLMREVVSLGGGNVNPRDAAIVLDAHADFRRLPGRRYALR